MRSKELNSVNLNTDSKTHRHTGGGCIAWELVFSRSKAGPCKRKTVVSRLFFGAWDIDYFSIIGTATCHMD